MNVESLIKRMKLRPGMYVGTPSLEAIFHFINGYLYNNIEANHADDVDMVFKNCFHEWVKVRLEKDHSVKLDEQRNYLFYINHIFPDTEQRINTFFELSNNFFSEIDKHRRDPL